VLTTGQVARICQVAPRTVSKWFDQGQLHGYRIPGSRDRRIPVDQLVAFMRSNGIPLTGLDDGLRRVLLVGDGGPTDASDAAIARSRLEIRSATNGFEAGVVAQQFRPHAVVLHAGPVAAEVVGICRNIKASPSFGEAWVLASCRAELQGDFLPAQGFAACVPSPYTLSDLLGAIDQLSVQTTEKQGRSWRA
jgi:excisionase family DNA binding protein